MKSNTASEPIIQVSPPPPRISVIDGYKYCKQYLGKEPIARLIEILRWGIQPGRISIRDYFYYRFCDPTLTDADRRQFVGHRMEHSLHRLVYDRKNHQLATDKCLFESSMCKAGFPTTQTLCLFQKKNDPDSSAFHNISKATDLEAWLQNASHYPVFGKPRFGIRSGGVLALEAYESATNELFTENGRQTNISAVVKSINRYRHKGYLFQRRLRSAPTS